MAHFTLGHRLPSWLTRPLFGDRGRFGLTVQPQDPCWQEWQRIMPSAYDATQKKSVGAFVNRAGYVVMRRVDLTGRQVLEIGPGGIDHMNHWRGVPARYVVADVRQDMLDRAVVRLREEGIPHLAQALPTRSPDLPFPDDTFDLVVSFYSLEHLYPLREHLEGLRRVLRAGGLLAGAIPCEGGLGWGTGRLLTTRLWFKKHTRIDPDKIICWEHPNFAEGVLRELDRTFTRLHLGYWPLRVPSIDLNLVATFIYEKPPAAIKPASGPDGGGDAGSVTRR
jgi:SAM-dependent methyltransferase